MLLFDVLGRTNIFIQTLNSTTTNTSVLSYNINSLCDEEEAKFHNLNTNLPHIPTNNRTPDK